MGGCHTSQDIATFTAKCEKYVGTESGGMDQAISIMGQSGVAKMIEFNPVWPRSLCHLLWIIVCVDPRFGATSPNSPTVFLRQLLGTSAESKRG